MDLVSDALQVLVRHYAEPRVLIAHYQGSVRALSVHLLIKAQVVLVEVVTCRGWLLGLLLLGVLPLGIEQLRFLIVDRMVPARSKGC